ncbi:winged helix-turn-helix domain-containing protein [Rhizobium helianthi]|uniref:Winged helix-turn-helix domain-containing protein n=1 Tax=Rhizobium helianthi TaxID=1132695 RepID=A0ABW4M4I9_9HYPH
MEDGGSLPLRPVLRIDFPQAERLGRGKIALLEQIAVTGSISAAGREMGMSYRRAWLLVDAINTMFAMPAVELQRGGKQGGGARLTPFGEELIARFRRMEQTLAESLVADLQWLEQSRAKHG